MRFIGNKENLVEKIYHLLDIRKIKGKSIFDVFSGTASVSKYFKKLNYKVISADLLYFSYVLQRAYICNNINNNFSKLLKELPKSNNSLFVSPLELIINYLNTLPLIEGFIYQNYTPLGSSKLNIPRMYFSNENGKKIDTIRIQIEKWKIDDLINENEYFILLACLIETVPYYANISGVFAAFQKNWDSRALKSLNLRLIENIINKHENLCYYGNSMDLIKSLEADIFYLDPPYNERQYAPNYHILETIAKYDYPEIYGISGMRDYTNQKSNFCNKEKGFEELKYIIENGKYKTLIMSYNTEGIILKENIIELMKNNGEFELIEFDYLRFKSNSNGVNKNKKYIQEQLYILRR